MTDWNDFYVAVAGASAALTGLIFVGVSISLTKILALPGLPDRALLSLVLLLNVLVLSLLFLVPGQTSKSLGTELLPISFASWGTVFYLDLRNLRSKQKQYRKMYLLNVLIDQFATISFIIAGLGMTGVLSTGIHWIVVAIIVSIVKAVIDGWVLLVEINR